MASRHCSVPSWAPFHAYVHGRAAVRCPWHYAHCTEFWHSCEWCTAGRLRRGLRSRGVCAAAGVDHERDCEGSPHVADARTAPLQLLTTAHLRVHAHVEHRTTFCLVTPTTRRRTRPHCTRVASRKTWPFYRYARACLGLNVPTARTDTYSLAACGGFGNRAATKLRLAKRASTCPAARSSAWRWRAPSTLTPTSTSSTTSSLQSV